MTKGATPAEVEGPRKPLFVWWSTEESVRDGIPSALACLEVIIAVLVYWAIAIYFETFTHLWVSICVAPPLLLKSNESVLLGVRWFDNYLGRDENFSALSIAKMHRDPIVWFSVIISIVVAIFTSALLSIVLVRGHEDFAAFWRCAAVEFLAFQTGLATGIGIAGLISGSAASLFLIPGAIIGSTLAIGIVATLAGLTWMALLAVGVVLTAGIRKMFVDPVRLKANEPLIEGMSNFDRKHQLAWFSSIFVGVPIGIWLRSIAIRFGATLRHLAAGFWAIPNNFTQLLFVIDIRHPAELVPGYERLQSFSSRGFIARIRNEQTTVGRMQRIFLDILFFVPAYAYRLSIKSTCWLYLPLIYIAGERDFAYASARLLDYLRWTPKELMRRALALLTLTAFFFTTLISDLTARLPGLLGVRFVSPLEYLFLIDFHTFKLWQIFNLLGAFITVHLFFAAGDARIDLKYVHDAQSEAALGRKTARLRIFMRLRNVLSAFLILVLFVHALLAFSPIMRWLPNYILRSLTWIYGDYMPPVPQ